MKGGEYMDSKPTVTLDDLHLLRKHIDAVIQEAQDYQENIGREKGGREISLVVTKLQEGKMWTGKVLEAMGSELPAEFADKAE